MIITLFEKIKIMKFDLILHADINLSAQSKDTAYNNRKFNNLTVKRKVTFAYQLSNKDDIYFAYDRCRTSESKQLHSSTSKYHAQRMQ